MNSVDYQKLFNSLMTIRDYCQRHECNGKCDFFITCGGCYLMSGKSPNFWHIPTTIITGMDCEELSPIKIEEKKDDKIMEEGDENVNQ